MVRETAQAGVSVASVARRHDLNANLLFNWKRRYGTEKSFLPLAFGPCAPSCAEIAKEAPGAGRIEIALAGGHRIMLEGSIDPHPWLADVLGCIAAYPINKIDRLLPWIWSGR